MTPYMRLMRNVMDENPNASDQKLRREFIRRALEDGDVAARIIHAKAGELYRAISQKAATSADQAERRRAFYENQAQPAERFRAELLRRNDGQP